MGNMLQKKISVLSFVLIFLSIILITNVNAQTELESTNYRILDPTFDSSGGISEGEDYNLISSLGPINDARLESGSYALGAGFPNGIQANVPLIRCVEASTDSNDTDCLNFVNNSGAQGECGTPGCYDRVRVEVDHQNNPIDTLYLIRFVNTDTNEELYLQSDNTLNSTYDIGDYLTICQIEGIDERTGSGCEDSSDPQWDEALQSTNVFGLIPGTTYDVSVKALSGDFTETQYSPETSVTLEYPMLNFDIDIADDSGNSAETSAPYAVDLGILELTPTTANDLIWLDLGTNIIEGLNLYVSDLNNGLDNGSYTIPSQSEDLDVDSGNDGGYGLKIDTATQEALGPIQSSSTYDTTNANEIGGLSNSDELIFFTDTTGSNIGQVTNGRVSIMIKALVTPVVPTGLYQDIITFTMVTNI